MAKYTIEAVEGIGDAYGKKLRAHGISNTDLFLAASRTKALRKELSKKTGIDERNILKWANHVDLFRIKGIGPQNAELLEAAGVDTVKELSKRKADSLYKKLEETNAAKKLVRRIPFLSVVTRWIETAKTLPGGLSY